MTTVEALKDLYVALGGELADVQDMSTNVAVLNAISAKYSGASDAVLNPEAVANIAAVADQIGGGESDFSTAEVTVVTGSNSNNAYDIEGVVLIENEELTVSMLQPSDPRTVTAVLYKGKQFLNANHDNVEFVSGNIEFDETYSCYVITGDCTITMYFKLVDKS